MVFCNDECVSVSYDAATRTVQEISDELNRVYKDHCWDKFFAIAYQRWDCGTTDYVFKCIFETLCIIIILGIIVGLFYAMYSLCIKSYIETKQRIKKMEVKEIAARSAL